MKIVVLDRSGFAVTQYDGVTNIAYNAATKVYTITNSGGSVTVNGDTHIVSILL